MLMLMVSTTSTIKVAKKKKKKPLIEGLRLVFSFIEIFAGCVFCFGLRSRWEIIALFFEFGLGWVELNLELI